MENKDDKRREEFFQKLEEYSEPDSDLNYSKFRELMCQANKSKDFDSV